MEMHSPFPALRDFHLKVKRVTMICASLALLQPLLSLTHWIFGSLMLPYKSSSRSAKYVRWCDSCSLATPMQGAELNTARQSSHKSPARDDDVGEHQWTHLRCEGSKGGGGGFAADLRKPPPFPSFRPKRSGVEKSHAPNGRKAGPPPPSFRRKPVSRQ